ncbi:MAG: hypothetical protein AB7Q27_26840 [Acidimicrobiia bacterium]
MTSKTRKTRISPATIISCLALFLALTGSAFAVGVAKNSVRSAQIVDGTVRTIDVRDNAVNAAKIAPDAVGNDELAENSVTSQQVVDETLTNQDLGAASVTSSEIADGSVGSADVGDQSLTANDLAADSVRSSEFGTVVLRQGTIEAIAAGANGGTAINCAAGEQLLSGGGQPGNFGVEMTSSRPSGNGWLYQAKNNNGSASTISAFALCLAN